MWLRGKTRPRSAPTEAVLLILKHIETREWRWISSEIVNYEIQQTPNSDRKIEVQLLTIHADSEIMLDETIIQHAEQLEQIGLKTYDALHLACAASVPIDVFLTTDDNILKKAAQARDVITISVENPLEWLWRQVKP